MDVRDHLALDEGKQALNIEQTVVTHDWEIEAFITAASLRIDDLCGPVVYRTITDELHNGGRGFIRPHRTPVVSVTSVTEYASGTAQVLTASDFDTQSADGYQIVTESGMNTRLVRTSGWASSYFTAGTRNVKLTYVAGRFATTGAVDGKWKTACALTLQHLWRPSAAGWQQSQTFGDQQPAVSSVAPWMVPRAVLQLLGHDLLPPGVG